MIRGPRICATGGLQYLDGCVKPPMQERDHRGSRRRRGSFRIQTGGLRVRADGLLQMGVTRVFEQKPMAEMRQGFRPAALAVRKIERPAAPAGLLENAPGAGQQQEPTPTASRRQAADCMHRTLGLRPPYRFLWRLAFVRLRYLCFDIFLRRFFLMDPIFLLLPDRLQPVRGSPCSTAAR
jgi:hypothetical protein